VTLDIRLSVDDRATAQVSEVLTRIEHVELRQLARDHVEERPFIELEVVDLGGEGGE